MHHPLPLSRPSRPLIGLPVPRVDKPQSVGRPNVAYTQRRTNTPSHLRPCRGHAARLQLAHPAQAERRCSLASRCTRGTAGERRGCVHLGAARAHYAHEAAVFHTDSCTIGKQVLWHHLRQRPGHCCCG